MSFTRFGCVAICVSLLGACSTSRGGRASDAGDTTDFGMGSDAGSPIDSSSPIDLGDRTDAGPEDDGGVVTEDMGVEFDAGPDEDMGVEFDAGPAEDMGPPAANDTCDSSIAGSSATGASVFSGTTDGLTSDGVGGGCGSIAADAVHRWYAPSAGTYTFDTEGSAFDTILRVGLDSCSADTECNDDTDLSGDGVWSSVTLTLTAGQYAYITVDGYDSGEHGGYQVNISAEAVDGGTPDAGPVDAGPMDAGPADAGPVDAGPTGARRIFVTAAEHNANFLSIFPAAANGLDAADMYCQLTAEGAGVTGTWRAWLSSPTSNAIDRIAGTGPWVNMVGDTVFMNRAALTVSAPMHSMRYTELGAIANEYVWTGTGAGGVSSGSTCSGWTSDSSSSGSYGDSDSTSETWTNYGFEYCYETHSILCFEQ